MDIHIPFHFETKDLSIKWSQKFTSVEITAFFDHFEKRTKKRIENKDILEKLMLGNILTPPELEGAQKTTQNEVFGEFIKYVNLFRKRQYEHELRPWCNELAENIRSVANQIIETPRNLYGVEKLLEKALNVEMPSGDSPYEITAKQVSESMEWRNERLQLEKDFEEFQKLDFMDELGKDGFWVKYNPQTRKILFVKQESDWYVVLNWASPVSLHKDRGDASQSWNYFYRLELSDGSRYQIRITNNEFGQLMRPEFFERAA